MAQPWSLKRPQSALRLCALLLTSTLLVSGCMSSESPDEKAARSSSSPTGTESATAPRDDRGTFAQVPEVAAQLQPSVVTVIVSRGNGSGVIYTSDGLILTNEHVVRGNQTVEIAFADGQRVSGSVEAVDEVTDLALVRAERRDLPPARFQKELPEVGSLAIVVGSPLGFQNTVTAGVISGLHREIPGSATRGQSLVDLIQTDAPISPGSSGGAVANAAGEVIGISEAYIPPQAGAVALGFAIPAATAVDIAEQLRRNGRARHAFVGVVPAPITPAIAKQLQLKSTEGVIVAAVAEGGPAARADVRPGDVITAVDGQPTPTPESFLARLRQYEPGDTLTLTIRRGGADERKVEVVVTDRPTPSTP